MDFRPNLEWDEAKRRSTLETRSVDFADVAAMDWGSALTRADDRQSESRLVTLGLINHRLYVLARTKFAGDQFAQSQSARGQFI